jgi:PKD repeat protein
MKNTYLLSIGCILCLMSLFMGCKKKDEPEPQPGACFTVSNRYTSAGQVTSFGNCSKNSERSEWNFGDGGSSTLESPSHKWESNGIFDVTLTAFKSSKNSKATKKVYIGQKGYVKCRINITQWKDTLPEGTSGFGWRYSLLRAADNTATSAEYLSSPRQYAANFTGDEGIANINEDVPLAVSISVFHISGNWSMATITGVNIIDGVQNPTGSVEGALCNFSYTVSAYIAP